MLEAVFNLSSRDVEVPVSRPVAGGLLHRRSGIRRAGKTRARRRARAARLTRPSSCGGATRESLAGIAGAARRHLGRGRAPTSRSSPSTPTAVDLCLFDRARGRPESARDPSARTDRPDLARVSAGRSPGPALWLSGARPLGAGGGAPLQPGQAAARSLCQGDQRDHSLERRALRILHDSADGDAGSGRRPLPTAPPACPSAWWWSRRSAGATTRRPARRGTARSSTRPTSRA